MADDPWYPVSVTLNGTYQDHDRTFKDAIRGTSKEDALEKAKSNWPAAETITSREWDEGEDTD